MIERAVGVCARAGLMRRLPALLCAALAAGCDASYPTAPGQPVPLALQLHVDRPLGEAPVRATYAFSAFVLRSDGAWEDVSGGVFWSSPDPNVWRSLGSGWFHAQSPGVAGVRAEYDGLRAFIDVVVIDPSRQVVPRLSISAAGPRTVGASGQATVALLQSDGSSHDVTAAAAWMSSDASVATVDRGHVVAKGPGTTRITVTYAGLTAAYLFSVDPPQG
jgi:hypothetical protein